MKKYNPRQIGYIKKSDKGFTLLEVLMAVSILTIGLLAVASLQISAMRGNSMSMTYTESTEKVQDIVEKLYNKNFSDPWLTDAVPAGAPDGTGGLNADSEATADHYVTGNDYTVYWNVADNVAKGSAGFHTVNGVKTIRVIVKWSDRGKDKYYKFDLLRNRI